MFTLYGKTTSTIIAALETDAKKILIICPATLKINWQTVDEHKSMVNCERAAEAAKKNKPKTRFVCAEKDYN